MRSTPVKDVSQALMNMAAGQAGKAGNSAGEFQKIWSSQMNRNNSGNGAAEAGKQDSAAGKPEKGSSLQEKDKLSASHKTEDKGGVSADRTDAEDQTGEEKTAEAGAGETENISGDMQEAAGASGKETEAAGEENGECMSGLLSDREVGQLSAEELEHAMEVLGGISLKLMQQIADTFGLSLEEVQAVMEGLGMEQMDLLDAGKLGDLLLTLGGAEDNYALITDGALYGKYRELMAQLDAALQEGAKALDGEPGTLQELLKGELGRETMPELSVGQRFEGVEEPGQLPEEYGGNGDAGKTANVIVEKAPESESQKSGQRQESRSEGKTDGNPQENQYVQSIRNDEFQPQLQQTQQSAQGSYWSENTREIMNQILDYMKVQLNADSTNLEMQLHPASLGTVQVQLASRGGAVTAHFIAQNETVKNALETQLVQLKEQFEEQGIKVEAIEVTVQSHEFERNLEQGRGRNQQTPDKKSRSRRVRLGGVESLEEPGEEPAAADRIPGGGSTVEYTA